MVRNLLSLLDPGKLLMLCAAVRISHCRTATHPHYSGAAIAAFCIFYTEDRKRNDEPLHAQLSGDVQ